MIALAARAAALLLAGAAVGLGVNALRPDGVRLERAAPVAACEAAPAGAPAFEALAPAEAFRLCGDAGVLVADVRSAERFATGHVAGAIHLPCAASGDAAARAIALMAGKHTVLVYGDGTAEASAVAESVRQRLAAGAARPARVAVLAGGFAAWDGAGLACSSGPCPECGAGKVHAHAD
jgi:rhodanese-related sulfurtransferase